MKRATAAAGGGVKDKKSCSGRSAFCLRSSAHTKQLHFKQISAKKKKKKKKEKKRKEDAVRAQREEQKQGSSGDTGRV